MKTCSKCLQTKPLDLFYRRLGALDGYNGQCKACLNKKSKLWQSNNRDKVNETKRNYVKTPKGQQARKKWESNFVASGGRKKAEARRAEKPISEARRNARKRWAKENKAYYAADRAMRRAKEGLAELDIFALQQAAELARLREQMLSGKWQVDHIIPLSKGGTNHATNVQVVPALWNQKKSNRTVERYFGANKEL